MKWYNQWLSWLDEREMATSLAIIRMLLALTILYDFLHMAYLKVFPSLFAPVALGGISDVYTQKTVPLVVSLFGQGLFTSQAVWAGCVFFSITLFFGLFSRTSAFALMIFWAFAHDLMPISDRAIDMLCRNILLILAFSGCGGRWSIDSFRTGPQEIYSWPRRMIIFQIVVMYFTAGIQKTGLQWWPVGEFSALYYILQDVAITRFEFTFLSEQPFFFFTQLSTAVSLLWQLSYPIVLLFFYYQWNTEATGRLATFSRKYRPELLWVAMGLAFHLALFATIELGMFPMAMAALYPCFVHPSEWPAFLQPKQQHA